MESSQHSLQAYDVVVVGAGLSGLRAAQSLIELDRDWRARCGQTSDPKAAETDPSTTRKHPLRVLVVEARKSIGGRVRGLQGLVPWSVEVRHVAASSLMVNSSCSNAAARSNLLNNEPILHSADGIALQSERTFNPQPPPGAHIRGEGGLLSLLPANPSHYHNP